MAYDFKLLGDKLLHKLDLKEISEEAAKATLDAMGEWLVEEAKKSSNKYDDMVAFFVPQMIGYAKEMAEKINPEG
jgi:hypothetical protein